LKEQLDKLVYDDHTRRLLAMSSSRFLDYHREWFRFEEIFGDTVANGLLKADFCEFRTFYNNMFSANRFLFPAMSGEQHGNTDASLLLARETVKLLEEKKKKYMEDYGEYCDE
jgi:hypothetical protein